MKKLYFKKLVKVLFLHTFFFGCESQNKQNYLYPSEKIIEIKYLCNLPFFEEANRHQRWQNSNPTLLIIGKEKAIVFFDNNQTYVLKKNTKNKLPNGKYSCSK